MLRFITIAEKRLAGKVIIALLSLGMLTPAAFAKKRSFIKGSVGENSNLPEIARVGTKQARIEAIRKCGGGRYTFCVRALVDNLKDPDHEIRKESAQYLGVLMSGKKSKGEFVNKALKDMIREQAVWASELKKKNEVEKESDRINRIEFMAVMILALGYIGDYNSATFLYDFMADKHQTLEVANEPKVRRMAAHSMGLIGNINSLVKLKERLKNEKVERNHVDILRSIIVLENTLENRQQLIEKLKSRDRWVRYYAADYIIDLKIREAIQPLENALALEGDEVVRERLYRAYMKAVYRDFPD